VNILVQNAAGLTDAWRKGTVQDGFATWSFLAKVYDRSSEFGINGGRISKLLVWLGEPADSSAIASFDSDTRQHWFAELSKLDDRDLDAVQALVGYLERLPRLEPIFDLIGEEAVLEEVNSWYED
jgi:hypothetical protein